MDENSVEKILGQYKKQQDEKIESFMKNIDDLLKGKNKDHLRADFQVSVDHLVKYFEQEIMDFKRVYDGRMTYLEGMKMRENMISKFEVKYRKILTDELRIMQAMLDLFIQVSRKDLVKLLRKS